MTRVERHCIKKTNKYYSLIDDFCFKSKNLYNHANYIIRQEYIQNKKWVRYGELDRSLKNDVEFPDYREMPTAQSAQQILRLIDKNWKSYYALLKDYNKNPSKYKGKPKIPKYLKSNGRNILILTNQNCKIVDNYLCFPKVFNGFKIQPQFIQKNKFVSFQQTRFIPKNNRIVIELVYNIEVPDEVINNSRVIAIDIGVNNLATICNNIGKQPIIINGRIIKAYNQYFNKFISKYKSICKTMNNCFTTNRITKITNKRNDKINDYLHKTSKFIIDYCVNNNISKIIIGNNKEWKQNANLGKRNNQNFVQIPFNRFIEMLQYKAQEKGIAVIITEESYTSGTSFIDNELPIKENYNKNRRIHRGLFVSNNKIKINADVNASYQIIKKVFPNTFSNGIEDVVLHPVQVRIA